tara:strand:- start:253 stop:765 length:513 start_codon:yes stop_codon:yes gene_type:complete
MEKILVIPHPKLRQKSDIIKNISKKELEISNKMIEILKNVNGVGLAANQIGVLKQIIAVKIKKHKDDNEKIYVLFNPKIKSFSKETVIMEEGCLSIPEHFAEIARPESIEIEYTNEKNEIISEKKEGYEARILQHEIDHLAGKLFFDYLSSLKRNKIIKRIQKLKKLGEI